MFASHKRKEIKLGLIISALKIHIKKIDKNKSIYAKNAKNLLQKFLCKNVYFISGTVRIKLFQVQPFAYVLQNRCS